MVISTGMGEVKVRIGFLGKSTITVKCQRACVSFISVIIPNALSQDIFFLGQELITTGIWQKKAEGVIAGGN